MANVISDETMEYVGILAKLELKDEEKESARQDMQKMLDYVDKLNELDTSKVEPKMCIRDRESTRRGDYRMFKEYTAMVDSEESGYLRSLLDFDYPCLLSTSMLP